MNLYDLQLPNDALLPEQFAHMRRAVSDDPNKRLWLAVLRHALFTYLKAPPYQQHSSTTKRTLIANEVAAWMASEDDSAGSYGFICDALGIDASSLRQGVQRARMAGQGLGLRSEARVGDRAIKLGAERKRRRRVA